MLFSAPLSKLAQFKVIQGQRTWLPSDSTLVHMTSILFNIVYLAAFEIFDVQVVGPRSRTFKGRPRSKVIVAIDTYSIHMLHGYIFDFC